MNKGSKKAKLESEAMPPARPLISPFTFDGWHGENLRNPDVDFAGYRARLADELATEYQKGGNGPEAERQKEEALWWRGLEHLPTSGRQAEEIRLSLRASKATDALLALAKTSETATLDVFMLADRVLSGLNALSAHGNAEAAKWLFTALFRAVDDFNMLAYHKPEAFQSVARPAAGLPGIITTNTEKISHNEELFKRLQVAQDNPVSVYGKGPSRPKLSTAANAWALRIKNYIADAQLILRTMVRPALLESATPVPDWSAEVMLLKPFSRQSWEQWFGVGWKIIMEATDGRPESQPALAQLGASRRRKEGVCGKRGKPYKQDGNVEAAICDKLRRAFKALATAK